MIVLTEYTRQLHPRTSSVMDMQVHTEIARTLGCSIVEIPQDDRDEDGEIIGTPDDVLRNYPYKLDYPDRAVFVGFIPRPERYQKIYDEARDRNVTMLNTPEEHQRCMNLHLAYPFIKQFTPATEFIDTVDDLDRAVQAVGGYPVFIKGTIQSMKATGAKACFAENAYEAGELTKILLKRASRSRGLIAIRKKVNLRHTRLSPKDFPLGREYRAFLYQNKLLSIGYYWDADDPLKDLSVEERQEVTALAEFASACLGTPYCCIDIGQTVDHKFIVIETGDPQVAGLSQNNPLVLWSALKDAVDK